jgi:hypothetical protein
VVAAIHLYTVILVLAAIALAIIVIRLVAR